MRDPNTTDTSLDNFSDLPMQPTGSGVADLEIAYEQMKLAAGVDPDHISGEKGAVDKAAAYDPDMTRIGSGEDDATAQRIRVDRARIPLDGAVKLN